MKTKILVTPSKYENRFLVSTGTLLTQHWSCLPFFGLSSIYTLYNRKLIPYQGIMAVVDIYILGELIVTLPYPKLTDL